ncbi:MAG: carbohydrate kinase family protein [Sedimentisphaerales bacterium]|jgi:sugar/nucleoside kinase (ribokinase family)
MNIDVLILNTAVADFRSNEFKFVEKLVAPGGLAKCKSEYMPDYSQLQYKQWIDRGLASAGGPGNAAPLMAKAGLKVAAGVNLGKGNFDGLDAQGRFFFNIMVKNNVDMSHTFIHPILSSGTTFIYEKGDRERGGIAYFPNANDDFDLEYFKSAVIKLRPKVVYYMYSGLSDRADANGGNNLADFMRFCAQNGAVTIADSHTLTNNPQLLLKSETQVEGYKILKPLLYELDLFFTSLDEARLIDHSLNLKPDYSDFPKENFINTFLTSLSQKFWRSKNPKVFGVTVKDGAAVIYRDASSKVTGPLMVTSKFMSGEAIDLVGAGDSFRAGLVTYIVKNIDDFKAGKINITEAAQMANLFASLYITASLSDRYGNIDRYENLLRKIKSH